MDLQRFLRVIRKKPFRPFNIHLADGRALRVTHPESVVVDPATGVAAVYSPLDGFEIIDVPQVTSMAFRRQDRKRPA
jgi:hypothetical protein